MSRRAIARVAAALAVLGVLVVAGVVVVRALTTPASTIPQTPAPPTSAANGTYLALGDSVPFGARDADGGTDPDFSDPASFVGYPQKVAVDRQMRLLNAAVPGETTDSFTGAFVAQYRREHPLHVDYGTQSQLRYAEQVLSSDGSVRLVSIQLGANDLFSCQARTADGCFSAAEVSAVVGDVATNLTRILGALRATGYSGSIVVMTYYSPDYSDAQTTAAVRTLDTALSSVALAHGARVADGFAAFRGAAEAKGGNSTEAGLVLPHDGHPTDRGQRVLADAVEAALG